MSKSRFNKLGLDNSVFKNKNNRLEEDVTEYGEFISTFDSWLTLEEQKRNADYLANIDKEYKKELEQEKYKY